MTDDKKAPDDLGEIDWNSALSDWGDNFVPEVAKDVVSDKPALLSGHTVSRPLYRPPAVPPAKAKGPPPAPVRPAAPIVDDDDDGATIISAIPREILRREGPSPAAADASSARAKQAAPPRPPTARGGLGQFFSRDDRRDAGASQDESNAESRTRASSDFRNEEVTSARQPPPRAEGSGIAPVRRPPVTEKPAAGRETLDPFASARAEQLTIPAESEIGDLLYDPAIAHPQDDDGPPSSRTPSILVPDDRQYNPDQDTIIASNAQVREALAKPPPSERKRTVRPPLPSPVAPDRDQESGLRDVSLERAWEGERPARAWLDESAIAALRERAAWLEEEARALADIVARGRGLLACSEILATVGDRDRAEALAIEARDEAPSIALAHRQARGLMDSSRDAERLREALDVEIKMTPAGPARVHSMILAADAAVADGDDEDAGKRLDQAARIAPADARVATRRAARALARRDPAIAAALRLGDGQELAPIADALRMCVRLRGAGPATAGATQVSPNEVLMRARQALASGDLPAAAAFVAELASIPELARGALWLAAALGAARGEGRVRATAWLRELVDRGEEDACRPLAARALEISDASIMSHILEKPGPLGPAERLILATLCGLKTAADEHLRVTAALGGLEPLVSAAAALAMPDAGDPDRSSLAQARAKSTAGSNESRALVTIGRLLGASASPDVVTAALDALGPARTSAARAVAMEMATRAGRVSDVSAAIEAWGALRGSAEDQAIGALAAAMVAERAGDRPRALHGYKAVRAADGASEVALRAIASLEQVDLVAEMNALADELGDGVRGAIARLEAITLGERVLPEPTQAHLLDTAHKAAPELPIAGFLAERIARRAGDVDEILRWIRDRRTHAADPTDSALDAVREALLIADRDPSLASERLREAHQGRPGDVALREFFERTSAQPLDDRAAWRERRAAEATGDARALLLLEAALENERSGDEEGALRCAEGAAAGDASLGAVARERAELRTGRASRLADDLFSQAKNTEDLRRRREAFERLAELDLARQDTGSALLWHRSIFEEQPDHKPSLRYLEQHLIGEGRDEEIEPIASAITMALRGRNSPECASHAELAARLRLRGAAGSWDATREMVEIAASERDPSLWALRMLQSHCRTRGDDAGTLAVTKRLVDRASRPLEIAALLVGAAEAATRLGNAEQARTLLERASVEDPGDVVAWEQLAAARRSTGDLRGAAEASEALARSSVVAERKLGAWYEAGLIWQDGDPKDSDRALAALESAAAIDVAYKDVFDRLSRIYAARKMQAELAQLLERRMDCVTDPEERLAIEVRRGRVLFEAGDVAGARQAYESALAERPDDAQALAAFTDLCLAQSDWEVAEQSLIRLARLLPTPDEQRVVYTQLGDLYSHHLVNLSRAEVALKEVLKCAPDDVETATKLVDVYRRQNDSARAVELQQELIQKSRSPEEKRQRVIELSFLHEQTAHDNRRAEQTLESARREFPQDVAVLRALAEFYSRHQQTPAFNILLDRAGADARRALTAGRLTPASFEVLATVFDLRGRTDAARVCAAMLATLEGQPVELRGAGAERAFDPGLDDLLAPEALTPPLRALLAKTGEALDAVTSLDLRAMKAGPVPADAPVARLVMRAAAAIGLGSVTFLSSPKLGAVCIPIGSDPPAMVIGEALLADERIGAFLALRALKLVWVKAAALGRTVPGELGVLVSAWLKSFNPGWQPPGINPAALTTAMGRIQAALPRNLPSEVANLALEVAAGIGTRQATLGPAALAWANRVAFLALGDPNAALDAIASAGAPGAIGVAGPPKTAPRDAKERAAWVARTPEARDLVAFGVTDAFAEARARLGLDR